VQSLSALHELGQLRPLPLHTYGAQLGWPPAPALRGEHVPTLPAELQTAQPPVHAVLQHTPSTQLPEVHWFPAVHAVPSVRFGAHAPVWQKCVAAHCASELQVAGHAVLAPLHENGAQLGLPALSAGSSVHVPTEPPTLHALHAPVHALSQHTESTHRPLTHALPALQACPFGSFGTHAPAWQKRPAAHCASVVHVVGHAAEVPLQTCAPHDGVPGLPSGAGAHVPGVPRSQRSHAPPHAESQHTPSAQLPDWHSVPSVHEAPGPFRPTHAIAVHVAPAAHWPAPEPVHDVAHDAPVPLHRYGAHDGEPTAVAGRFVHVPTEPAALHALQGPAHAEVQHTPSAQNPDWHAAPLVHALPAASRGTQAPIEQKCVAAHCASAVQPVGHALVRPSQT